MIIIAADPGLRGAICALKNGTQIVWLSDMPVKQLDSGKYMVCAIKLKDILKEILADHPQEDTIAIIEQVATRPGEGAVGAFSFGRGFGILEASIVARGITLEMVRPQTWKKSMGMTADKDDVRFKMMKQFPGIAHMLKRKKDDGRAEALAIALYLWQKDYA